MGTLLVQLLVVLFPGAEEGLAVVQFGVQFGDLVLQEVSGLFRFGHQNREVGNL